MGPGDTVTRGGFLVLLRSRIQREPYPAIAKLAITDLIPKTDNDGVSAKTWMK